jgi:hypothetical protein
MLTPKSNESRERPFEIALLVGTTLFILCIQVLYLINFNINWDEFLYLSLIFEYSSGTLSKSLQTFYVHFFTWMTNLEWDEVQLILLSRTLMLVCELLTLSCIFLISRKFVSDKFALIGVVSYLASGFVLMQGTSFRADPMITALLMASIYLLLDSSKDSWRFIAASIAVALACLISIKSVFYIPPLIGALVWRTRNIGEMKNKIYIYIGFALSVLTRNSGRAIRRAIRDTHSPDRNSGHTLSRRQEPDIPIIEGYSINSASEWMRPASNMRF